MFKVTYPILMKNIINMCSIILFSCVAEVVELINLLFLLRNSVLITVHWIIGVFPNTEFGLSKFSNVQNLH